MVTSDFRLQVERWSLCTYTLKNMQHSYYIYEPVAKIAASYRKSGSRNTTVTLNFKPEIELWQFCTSTIKITQLMLIN